MAVEFLDEPVAPAANGGGVEFLDESNGGGPATPADAGEIEQRFLDPNYQPSLAEFKVYDTARSNRSVGKRAGDFVSGAGSAVKGVAELAVRTGKGIYESAKDPEKYDPLLTAAEGVARGTIRDLELASKLLPSEMLSDGVVNFDQFAEGKRAKLREASLQGKPLTPENFKTFYAAGNVPADTLSQWRKEFDEEFVPQSRFENFLTKRAKGLEEMQRSQSTKSILTGQEAAIHPDVAEGVSMVATPMAIVPFGKALTPAKSAVRVVAAKTLEKGGRALEVAGETVSKVAALPERAVGKGFEWLSGSVDAGKAAENVVKRGSVPTAVAGVAGFGVPGLTETAAAVAGGKVAGRTLQGAGQVAQAAGRSAAAGPSRYGVFSRIAKDSAAPEWLRRAASAARPLDPAASLAGSAVKGATEGAAIGTVLGAAADGEEGAAAGFGSGLAIGAGGGLAGRVLGAGKYTEALKDSDLAAWIAGKSPEEVANIASLKLSRDAAVNLADVERLAKGGVSPLTTGDVEFRYVTDKQFSDLFGVGKGAQMVQGDRPVVFVNTGYKGGRSAFHEVMHALDALEGFAPQRQQLNRVLFDQTLPDGQVVSKGLFNGTDLAEFTSQYRSRLNQAARSEFDLLTPEERQARIMGEVRSESFANLVNGYSSGRTVLGSRGLRQRVADTLLLAEGDSMLGKMRTALERVGVKFTANGEPSELFVKNGKPITNTPAVDAALRDYVRAKDNITRKLVAGDDGEFPGLVVTPEDFAKNPTLAETFKDSDIFAKNPDGTLKVVVKPSEVAKIESQEQVAIKAARDAEAIAATAKQTAEAAAAAILEAEARATAAEQIAAQSQNREAVAQAKADKVKWREARRRGAEQLKTARAQEKAAREQAAAAKAKSVQLKNAKLSAGVPVLLSEREINLVQSRRTDAMMDALTKVPNLGEVDAVRPDPKVQGGWIGRSFSDKQLAAFDALPDDVLSPSMKSKLHQLNALARQDGQQIIMDYSAALKGGKYSSGIAPTTRAGVPIVFKISKAGNFLADFLDTTHFFRKLGQWRRSKPRAFDAWNGDADAFLRDAFTYLDNHVNGRRGSVNLDADGAVAELKKDVINSFFNVPQKEGVNPLDLNSPGNKDNLIRSRRFDRINRITPGAGDKFPIRYEKLKANFLPAAAAPTSATTPQAGPVRSTQAAAGISPVAIQKHIRAQAEFDLAQKSPGPANLNQWLASEFLTVLDKVASRHGPMLTRTAQLQRVQTVADSITPAEMAGAFNALLTGGQQGARQHLERLAAQKAGK